MAVRNLQNSIKPFQTSEPLKLGKGSGEQGKESSRHFHQQGQSTEKTKGMLSYKESPFGN